MTTPVPSSGSTDVLASYAVGRLASATHPMRWASGLAFLLGRALPVIAAQSASTSSNVVGFYYRRSPGCAAVLLALTPPLTGYAYATVLVTVDGSAYTPVGNPAPTGLGDGSTHVFPPPGSVRGSPLWYVVLDVSGLSVGAVKHVEVRLSAGPSGAWGVTAVELPQDLLAPESGDPGADASSFLRPATIQASSTTGRGLQALYNGLTDARTKVRRHLQYAWADDTAPTTSSLVETAVPGAFLRTRARRLYAGGTGNACRFYARAAVTAGTGTLKLYANGSLLGTLSFTSSTPTDLDTAVTLPTTAGGQLVTLELRWLCSTTASFALTRFAVIEEEA